MKIALVIPFLFAAFAVARASGSEHWVSSDYRFEAYTTSRNPDETGAKLYVRAVGGAEIGALLRENDRWIKASWSPDSRFLAVIDGSDGHVTDVFVYRVFPSKTRLSKIHYERFDAGGEVADWAQSAGIVADLRYHTPNLWTYDVQWDVTGWLPARHIIRLTKTTRWKKTIQINVCLDLSFFPIRRRRVVTCSS